MRKLFAGLSIAAVLVSGFFVTGQTDGDDLSWGGERPPPVVRNVVDLDSFQ
jgi:hypothetical protein